MDFSRLKTDLGARITFYEEKNDEPVFLSYMVMDIPYGSTVEELKNRISKIVLAHENNWIDKYGRRLINRDVENIGVYIKDPETEAIFFLLPEDRFCCEADILNHIFATIRWSPAK